MYSLITSSTLLGLDAEQVTVETDLSPGLPGLSIVGLPDQSVKEARERVRAAIVNSGYPFPSRRITVNLSPANTRKEGTQFDLPIAVGILSSAGQISSRRLARYAMLGELSLDGRVQAIRGALPLIIGLRNQGYRTVILPQTNVKEASVIYDVDLIPVSTLSQVIDLLSGKVEAAPVYQPINEILEEATERREDFSDVAGQEGGKRAMQICASALHNLLLMGPPGAGKTMMARRLPGILPALTYEEQLEVTKIYSVAGELTEQRSMIRERPFRDPHHTITATSLVGGGSRPRPGEISLAHYGVLFLDELPEYPRHVLELLRQPMEDRSIAITRVHSAPKFPAQFMLVAAANPCPCGHFGNPGRDCSCSRAQIDRYLSKISGPLLDRIDLQIQIQPVPFHDLFGEIKVKTSQEMRNEVEVARAMQLERFEKEGISYNSQMTQAMLKRYCSLDRAGRNLLEGASRRLSLSARAHHKIMKVSRTIADMDRQDLIGEQHLAEAIQYRSLDRRNQGGQL